MQESQFRMTSLPSDVTRLEVLMHDHESSRPTVMELFKFSYTELQQLMKKINESVSGFYTRYCLHYTSKMEIRMEHCLLLSEQKLSFYC